MNISGLRARVVEARSNQQSEAAMKDWLEHRLPDLHPAIAPEPGEAATLLRFINAYIGQVPDILEAAEAVAETARLRTRLLPVLKVAEAFFLQPPALPADHQGMLALLDEAYLAHRLVEEVNDRYVMHGCGPLIPLGLTRANLIVHQLLGEPFSNELDAQVERTAQQLIPETLFEGEAFQAYKAQVDRESCSSLWNQWPCMSEELGVEIKWRGAA